MSIKSHPGKPPLTAPLAPSWGELLPEGKKAAVVRFVLPGRIVSLPMSELKWWEVTAGEPEFLTVHAGEKSIAVSGRNLGAVAGALDEHRVTEIRANREHQADRTAPQVREITIETA